MRNLKNIDYAGFYYPLTIDLLSQLNRCMDPYIKTDIRIHDNISDLMFLDSDILSDHIKTKQNGKKTKIVQTSLGA
jgi:hypothetical protein